MDRASQVYEPETVLHPGETVTDYLESLGWSQRDLARRAGISAKTVSEICNGKAPITASTALAFENVFGRPAHLWLNLQRRFDEYEERQRVRVVATTWKSWAKKFPIQQMTDFGWLDAEPDDASRTEALLKFFGVTSPDSWQSVWDASSVAYRQTRTKHDVQAVSAWVRATELLAAEIDTGPPDLDALMRHISVLRAQTAKKFEKGLTAARELCAKHGVAVVCAPYIPNTGISGCARWLTDSKALIGLTLRYTWDDQFWFTFFHELAHLLLHRKRLSFVIDNAADTLVDKVVDPEMQKEEEEANRFAADTLVPPSELTSFMKASDFTSDAIHKFAEKIGVGPGVVVGRLQHDSVLQYFQGNQLKQKLHGHIVKAAGHTLQ